ncbi:hybrid sensor histidine kinase/response regulator [Desulfocicer niacini]
MDSKIITLLLIEDDKVDQMAFERFVTINNLSYDYAIAGSVTEAEKILKTSDFDIIISDYMLSDGSSFELFGSFRGMPVIFTTGTGNEEVAVEAMKSGASDYLIKDPQGNYLKTLPATVDLALKRKHNEDQLRQYHERLEVMVMERTAELEKRTDELEREIAEHKRTETKRLAIESQLRQSQKMESIGLLAGGIAHDFNNILTSIIGFAQIALEDAAEGSAIEDDLNEILTAGTRAKDLVKQILTIARRSDEERVYIRIDLIAREVVKFIRSSIPTTIEIQSNITSCESIMGNQAQMHQVFMNLFTNAAHAMEKDGGKLYVEMEDIYLGDVDVLKYPDLKSGKHIKIMVSDTGSGMSQEILDLIFDPYFTTKKAGEGTGLGLAMVHSIIVSYGGTILVSSQLGKGSVFTIYLPVAKKIPVYETHKPETLPRGTEKILFVDDELPIVKLNQNILQRFGYQVTPLIDSLEALAAFKANPREFDLLITDMTMPHLTGEKLAQSILEIRPELPIILCTGYSKKLLDGSTAINNIKAVLKKPIPRKQLLETVRSVLDGVK